MHMLHAHPSLCTSLVSRRGYGGVAADAVPGSHVGGVGAARAGRALPVLVRGGPAQLLRGPRPAKGDARGGGRVASLAHHHASVLLHVLGAAGEANHSLQDKDTTRNRRAMTDIGCISTTNRHWTPDASMQVVPQLEVCQTKIEYLILQRNSA